jgi:hopanoid biosynthesis associated protein HpnK
LSLVVVTADDFGLAREVNEAVEVGHRQGILSAASLMTSAPFAADAVERARAMPDLRVGLHLAVTDAAPASSRHQIPDLLDAEGRLRGDLVRLGLELAVSSRLRRQMSREIEAQFAAYGATGLALDHVNVHQHFHLHPAVAAMVLEVAADHGASTLRTPIEPRRVIAAAGGRPELRGIEELCAAFLGSKARKAGFLIPEAVFGLRWSGQMTAARLVLLLKHMPPGLSEIYMHPATRDDFPGAAKGYRYVDELAALVDPLVSETLQATGHRTGGYMDGVEQKPGMKAPGIGSEAAMLRADRCC